MSYSKSNLLYFHDAIITMEVRVLEDKDDYIIHGKTNVSL